ncbi:MAG: glycoside hydrolase family 32 protein [Pseudobutyrivibrio sp.]|uniref:glycoside hydrolase family 32 protein n=1 Tax=Pseudobutyrivibrio sp. TaxID=2014367 RepID=UPI0025F6B101|nr:GH32 C-terminal domain-containing protein [Pseudobutyrivibrio sp.]MBQ8488646.1 glycoside hydrolase family 32 protein [Pseudobutyrivibrio sp.]
MISKKLQEARDYENNYLAKDKKDIRPLFHLTGTVGWINDPNGFSRFGDKYHLFYQYHPYNNHWGPMHWGHSTSEDLIKWEYLPCALAPDEEYDKDGCFSGSAIELDDGKLLLMYTSVLRREDSDGEIRDYQQQSVAIGDGVNFEKVSSNPVISTDMIPAGGDRHDFRDPKIIKYDGKYYCFAINRHPDGSGQILVYESDDAITWSFNKVLDRSDNQVGRIWECPDYFALDDKKVLIVSPQETEGKGDNIFPGFNNFFLIGEGEGFLDFDRQTVLPIDFGPDFYAAQTIETVDGRRVMIAWMQNWETVNCGNDLHDYYSTMTLPRKLEIKDGHVYQQPIKELDNYRINEVTYNCIHVQEEQSLDEISGRIIDISLSLKKLESDYCFTMKLAKDDVHETLIKVDSKRGTIKLDRTNSGVRNSSLSEREFSVDFMDGTIELRIIIDRFTLEVFVNEGKQAASMKIDTDIAADKITFMSDETVVMDITKYDFEEGLF